MKQKYTEFGLMIKIKLAQMETTQTEFCRTIGVNPARLSEIIHKDGCHPTLRKKVSRILGIKSGAPEMRRHRPQKADKIRNA